ncbi:ankyrin repeat, SAM and basic leucine zipper domain-containing protein 1-like [Elysia marginata]|uniref:Ankyrin repeat, SAM and basic leucine zipper domain-containing protein 1 n=1 Tax=Elysia marginata TaxID=1093978 RepID=A0AAV4IYV7_9GAST|nr:ankyrin repeat, SAM and basic leucine zipper domain-containing protein 1-like [Elysia marginata]
MSFMPAEEAEDLDYEDGFIDCGDFKEYSDSYTINNSWSSNDKSGFQGRTERTGFSRHHEDKGNQNRLGFSPASKKQSNSKLNRSQKVMTPEDLRMGIMKNNTYVVKKYYSLGLGIDEPLRSGWTALMYAAHYVRPEFVKLLLRYGANVNFQCDMFTPLMCACSATSGDEQGVSECVRILTQAGADINARDRYQVTPLMLSSKEGHLLVVKTLIAQGAQVNMRNSQGWTALTMATQRSRAPVVVELLDSGADVNIQHSDKLTVKDLAAHLPSDDMLALLERRPVNSSKQPVQQQKTSSDRLSLSSNNCTLDSGDDGQARLTDLRYGELEVFLLGLDLGHLVSLFQEQLIDLRLLMTLTEQDLINAGVTQVGARKKILDAVQAVHKKVWQPSSLVSIHYNKRISCGDAVAMLANSSRHLHYICSTVVYVKEQLRRHPETIMIPTDRVSPSQFMRHTEDTIKNLQALSYQVDRLKADLGRRMLEQNLDPPDLIKKTGSSSRFSLSSFRKRKLGATVVLLACLATVALWGKDKLRFLSLRLLSR